MNDFFNKCLECNSENIILNLSKNEINEIYLSKKCNKCNQENEHDLTKILEEFKNYQINENNNDNQLNDNIISLFKDTENKINEINKFVQNKIIYQFTKLIESIIKFYNSFYFNNNNILRLGQILKDKYKNSKNHYLKTNIDNIFIKNNNFFEYNFKSYVDTEEYLKQQFFININFKNKLNIQNDFSLNSFNFLIYEINKGKNVCLSCYENKKYTLTTYDIISNKIIFGPKNIHNNIIKTIKYISNDNNDYLFSLSLDKSIKILNINNNFSLFKIIKFNYDINNDSILNLEVIKSNKDIYIIHSGINNVIYYYLLNNKFKEEQIENLSNKKEILNSNNVIILNKYYNNNNNYITFCNNENIVYLYDFEKKKLFKYNKFQKKSSKITFCNIVKFDNNFFYLIITIEKDLYYIKYNPNEKIKIKNEKYIEKNYDYIFNFFINFKDYNLYLLFDNKADEYFIFNIDKNNINNDNNNKNDYNIIINKYIYKIVYFNIIKINDKNNIIFLDEKGNYFIREINK